MPYGVKMGKFKNILIMQTIWVAITGKVELEKSHSYI